ncbi:YbaK/EbsC family protein [Candidatus Aerophobetes bacterium]|nr:YbaK/EbsC family protein [Candidatus Aerophobetes bacterium]
MTSEEVKRVQDILDKFGLRNRVIELPSSTKSAREAASAIGCRVEQIAKSIIFKTHTGKAVLVIASGANRVNERKIEEVVGEFVKKADPQFVLNETGFKVGGVPPVGHLKKPLTFIDRDLMKYQEIWAAGGSSNAVFKLTPQELLNITGGEVICVK